jgi:predicted lysophospholipase L1 biosynthesis ABC-type transport system permease subunit
VNTLMLSVFERTHEIGLLRAVGMERRRVKAMIRSESVIIALFGAVVVFSSAPPSGRRCAERCASTASRTSPCRWPAWWDF